jgi:hypothetical protein
MASITYTYSPSWDAGARTISGFIGDGSLSFTVLRHVGVICGLSSVSENQSYTEIEYGFYISQPMHYRIIELGVLKTSSAFYTPGATFKIERLSDAISYYIDNVLVYESLVTSTGPLFGDSSIYFYMDEIDNAEIIDLGGGSLLPETIDVDISLGSLWASGVEGDANFGYIGLGPVSATGSEGLLAPEYNAGDIAIGPIDAFGYEGYLDTSYGNITLGELWAKGAEGPSNWGAVVLGTLYAFGYSHKRRYLTAEWPEWTVDIRSVVAPLYIISTAELTWPAWSLSAKGVSNVGRATLYWPPRVLTAYGGGSAQLTWPTRTLTMAGTLESVGTAELTWPDRVLTASGLVGGVATAELTWPERSLTAYGGGSARLTWPARVLTIAGTLDSLGTAALTWPQWRLTAAGWIGGVGTAELTWPTRALTATGITGGVGTATLRWPALVLTAIGDAVTAETTYAINVSTGAVTQLLLGKFDKLVLAHGRLYGLRDGVLLYLGGDTDQGAEIPVTIRFAPQQFGTYLVKRLDGAMYLNTRESDGVTLTLVQDETVSWKYQTATDTAPAMGTHRVKVGRGVAFHSLGVVLENREGGALTVGGLEIPVLSLTRKPR